MTAWTIEFHKDFYKDRPAGLMSLTLSERSMTPVHGIVPLGRKKPK